MKKVIEMARKCDYGYDVKKDETYCEFHKSEEEIIQSLSTQQLLKEFIPEFEEVFSHFDSVDNGGYPINKSILKTITNSEGKQELVGTYKY